MNAKTFGFLGAAALLVSTVIPLSGIAAEKNQPAPAVSADHSAVDKIIAAWPERPRLGAQQMLAQYGIPQEVTSEQLIWHNQGPFKRITVTKAEHPHDFPIPHTDYIEHTVDYKVPEDKADELMKYDGSLTFDRTRGEMSARCDLEGHNILTLNVAHDIVTGKSDVEEARKVFGKTFEADIAGAYPAYTAALQFKPGEATADPGTSVIPGAPKRAEEAKAEAKAGGDAEILAMLLAVDMNEVVAAMEAAKKKLPSQVADYAKLLHTEHGKHSADTMKLGLKIGVTPVNTPAVEKLRIKGAGELAAILPLEGEEFAKGYLDSMVKGHTEVLDMIDNQLLKSASNEAVKNYLAETRKQIAEHLEKAKKLQGEAK